MARPMGSVRLKKANPITMLIGALLCIFIFIFLVTPSGTQSRARSTVNAAVHHLSPPTSPYRKPNTRSGIESRPPPVVHYNLNNVTISRDPIAAQESVLILSPMARFYDEYWDNLMQLTYPHELITLGFILPKTKEGNAATTALQKRIKATQHGPERHRFRSIIILRQDFEDPLHSQEESERHKLSNQKIRRAAMAKARNSLLFTTLGPATSWVLWLDSDIVETPPTLIQDLAAYDKPILVPNCFQRFYDDEKKMMSERAYDYNSWQESEIALDMAKKMGPDDILVEGYAEMATWRALMSGMASSDPKEKEVVVPLDGVGGTALLVRADVHRDGAMFPPFAFYNLIETEGFAKMAKRLKWQSWGLPNYRVYHYNE